MMDIKDKHVLVIGLGRFGGGLDATLFAVNQGAEVCVTDRASAEDLVDSMRALEGVSSIRYALGGHERADVDWADVIVVNPAIPDSHPMLTYAREQEKLITNSVNLFFERCPAQIVGITGANGKSTTTALTAHLLRALPNRQVWLSGNIGHQPLLGLLDQVQAKDLVVLELSSFQTERMRGGGRGAAVALLTNLTPNHLDRHGTFESYCAAKEVLFQTQVCDVENPCLSLFYEDDAIAQQWLLKYQGQAGRLCQPYGGGDVPQALCTVMPLPGQANLANLAGARAIAHHFGVTDEQIAEVLPSFQGLPHRLECVKNEGGVRWFNDSIATTPESTLVALDAFEEPTILIAGGYDKGICFDALGKVIGERTKGVVLLGQTAPALEVAIRQVASPPMMQKVGSLEEGVSVAREWAEPGDVVVLSPACASYDMFTNFQERGEVFTRLAQAKI